MLAAAKLESTIGIQHASGDVTVAGDNVVQVVDGDPGLHHRIDRVSDDSVGEHVRDRAHVQSACPRAVFGNTGQPQFIRRVSSEVAVYRILMQRQTHLACLTLLLVAKPQDPAVGRADPLRPPQGHHLTSFDRAIDQQLVTELRVICVGVEQCVNLTHFGQFGFGDRGGHLSLIRLANKWPAPVFGPA